MAKKLNIKLEYKTLEEVPKSYESLYEPVEKEGEVIKYAMKPELAKALSGSDLKKKVKELQQKLDETTQKNVVSEEDVETPKEVESAPKEDTPIKMKIQKDSKSVEADKAVQKQLEALNKKLEQQDQANKTLQNRIKNMKTEEYVTKAIQEKGGSVPLLKSHLLEHIGTEEKEDGSISFFVKDSKGDQRYSDVTSEPLTVSDILEEFKTNEDYKSAFTERKATPIGSNKHDKENGRVVRNEKFDGDLDSWSPEDRAEVLKKIGPEEYKKAAQSFARAKASDIRKNYDKNRIKKLGEM